MTATYIKTLWGWRGDARVYRMDPPLEGEEFVAVSAVVSLYTGPETYIFPCDKDGEVKFGEIGTSRRGTLRHAEVLGEAGYTIVENQS